MRIEKVILKNFRLFNDAEFVFNKKTIDLHVFTIEAGLGKTILLNAINWCLCGRELSRPVSAEIDKIEDGGAMPVSVELHIRHSKYGAVILKNGKIPHQNNDANMLVKTLFPKGIKDILLRGEDLGIYYAREITVDGQSRLIPLSMTDKVLEDLKMTQFSGILFVDSPFERLDESRRSEAMSMFAEFAKQGQVILLVSPYELANIEML